MCGGSAGDREGKETGRGLDDCIRCGHCENRCPFHVKQIQRMEEIAGYLKE
ncbi:MAG TPA: 4Fe-4S dicluster domain-containing protein [Candidatus Fusicatenibacter merdavium]|uniref:4Fe-4S dicluster domain-containing protein n=1 Tax=Candidatus Fusicatenibacter merdavium TaxID=2838600 RepID=A0A9D2BHU4_9FIRM|nr:4Fe-4S dicluster domain-containing protein [Candidatus Fusicatenibacter merdavium]